MIASFHSFLKSAEALKLGERGNSDAAKRLNEIRVSGEEVITAARAAIANHVDLTGEDPVRAELDTLLNDKVGRAPTSEQLRDWNKEAEIRYGHRMGPGHMDQDKMKHPTYMLDGLVYDKRYADFYLWMQTISHASEPAIREVVMITNDRKADWWKVTDHGIAGPLPEICSEIRSKADIERFWMYDLETFLREAEHRLDVSVSETTLSDVSIASDYYIEHLDSKRLRFLRKTDPSLAAASQYYYRADAEHHGREQRSRMRLKDTLVTNGFQVMDASETIAIGYRIGDDNRSIVGAAVFEPKAHSRAAAMALREEVSTMSALTEARRIEIYVSAATILTAIDDGRVSAWVHEQIVSIGIEGVTVEVYYGAEGMFKLITTIET